jgi:hypothetical protein
LEQGRYKQNDRTRASTGWSSRVVAIAPIAEKDAERAPESLAAGCKIYKVLYTDTPTGKKTPNPQKWRQPVCLRLRARSALRPSRTPR